MGLQSAAEIDGQRRSEPRPESPWMVDQRRAPRSVRPPSPYAPSDGNRSSNHNYLLGQRRRQRQRPSPRTTNRTNPFDSPSTSSLRTYNTTTPASRNPSPSYDHRMLYTPPSGRRQPQRGYNPFGSTPSPRHPIGNMRNANANNPFNSPSLVKKNRTNPFESPSPMKRPTGNNPFESPESIQQQREQHEPNDSERAYHGGDVGNGMVNDDSHSSRKVRVTVRTQERTPTKDYKQHDSVAVDSLDQILDTTEETLDESDEVVEDAAGGNEGWVDEPNYREQQQQYHPEEGYHSQHQLRQHQLILPHHLPSTPSPVYMESEDQLMNGTTYSRSSLPGGSDDDTNSTATPSEKALRAAERLKKSFEQRRRQRAAGIRTEATIDEEGGQPPHDSLALHYNRSEEEAEAVVLSGVAGRRRAEADFKNTAAASSPKVEGDQNKQLQKPDVRAEQNENRAETAQAEGGGGEEHQEPTEGANNDSTINVNYTLHDLCDEAVDTDDLAWRNALYLLSVEPHLGRQIEPECNMTPLHVACLAQQPPPVWIIRGLLYAAPENCSRTDTGGRLPLHLLVATSAHIDTIRLLVEEYPPAVAHRDARGFTPLQLLLKRADSDGLTLEHLRLLLGQQMDGAPTNRGRKNRLLFRKGEHLNSDWVLQELESLGEERDQKHESAFREYPDDVRRTLTKLSQWKRRQVNKQTRKSLNGTINHRSNEENHFLRWREADFVTPASIATPTGQLLPLHLLSRRNAYDAAVSQDIHSVKRARLVDLLRILIAAYPQGLVEVDANGKTPVMTAMLQSETTPSEEVVELLLGFRTGGFDGKNGLVRPAFLATGDTFQLPLHVAAEEMLSNYSLLSKICAAYPDARTVQDIRGRTPLHLALQNYRSVRIDQPTLELLFVEPVAKIRDNDGNTPLDMLLENPRCIMEDTSSLSSSPSNKHSSTILQEFFDASIERPRNRFEAEEFLSKFQNFPPWLRRQACAARFVQDLLVEEIASPFTTFRILGSGIVLCLLLLALRRMLYVDPNYTFLIYYLAIYHLIMQMIHWGIAIYMREFFRVCVLNVWRWIDLATVVLSTCCAIYVSRNVADISDVAGTILIPLGASATMACWLSLLGYFVEWSCGLAVFVGSAVQLLSALVWPTCVAAMGFFAVSQVLSTLEDCMNGGILCSLSDAYELFYLTTIGHPVLTGENYEWSRQTFVIIILFTALFLWWIGSVIAVIVTEANQLDRRQISLAWFWEPKSTLTVLTHKGSKNTKMNYTPSLMEKYCNTSEKYWHIFASALCGEKSDVFWDACCFRTTPMLVFTGFAAVFVLPIWFAVGLLTLGILWPPQIRRWLFCPRSAGSTILRKRSHIGPLGLDDDDLTKTKLSKLQSELFDLKAITQDQNYQIQKDLGDIKDVILRAFMEDNE